jgi:hypothetical protein
MENVLKDVGLVKEKNVKVAMKKKINMTNAQHVIMDIILMLIIIKEFVEK